MDNKAKIERVSRMLSLAALALVWFTPLLLATYWWFFNDFPAVMKAQLPLPPGRADLPAVNRFFCLLAGTLPAGAAMYGFAALRRLFALYASGEVFSRRNVRCYHRLGRTLLFWAGAMVVHTTLLSLAMSLGMPPGQRHVVVGFGGAECMAVLAGLAALVISWVMDEARRIDEDQALTI